VTRRALAPALVALALGCSATGPTAPTPAPVDDRWKTNVDFAELRARYAARSDFAEVCSQGRPLHETLDEIAEKDWTTALNLSESWLASCPVDMDAHFLAAVALTELEREEEAQAHIDWYRGLVESVLATGDGHTPETAWVVISAQEEYSILQALHVELLERRPLEDHVDAMTVEVEGQTRVFYFRPGVPVSRPRPGGSGAE
jgi:hypothetical protein